MQHNIYQNQAKRMGGPFIPQSDPPGPKWLLSVLGVDFFDSVVSVYGDFEFTDEYVRHLLKLRTLRSFQAEGSLLTDEGIARIAEIRSIRLLNVSGSQLTDNGTKVFQTMPNLETLQLWNTNLTDASVENLSKLTHLKSLYLGSSSITEDGFKKIQMNLPDCYIQWSRREPPTQRPNPIDARYAGLLREVINVALSDKSLKSTITSYGPDKIDHVVLDSTSIPWPLDFESHSKTLDFVHLRTYRDAQTYSKRLTKSNKQSLCFRLDKFKLTANQDGNSLFDGPIVIVIYNRGGNMIGGCRAAFTAEKNENEWTIQFKSAIDP